MSKYFFIAVGWLAVGLGLIGVILPGLPTVPFMLLAALAFGKGSPAARAWLIDHAHFGPGIRNWEENGAISRGAKVLASSMMALMFAISLILGAAWWILLLQGVFMGAGAWFVLSRPNGPNS